VTQKPLSAFVATNPSNALVPLNTDAAGNLRVVTNQGDATQVAASSGNVAAAVATATLPAVAGKTNYLSGFDVSAAGATAAAVVLLTVTGVVDGPLTYVYTAPAGATVAAAPLRGTFNPPLPASAPNTAIAVSLPSLGTGNTNAAVNAYGFVQ
jgi:hypothetical protein